MPTPAEAYVTLMECAGQKEVLKEKIEESNKKIGIKRRQMEDLREELRVLGETFLNLLAPLLVTITRGGMVEV